MEENEEIMEELASRLHVAASLPPGKSKLKLYAKLAEDYEAGKYTAALEGLREKDPGAYDRTNRTLEGILYRVDNPERAQVFTRKPSFKRRDRDKKAEEKLKELSAKLQLVSQKGTPEVMKAKLYTEIALDYKMGKYDEVLRMLRQSPETPGVGLTSKERHDGIKSILENVTKIVKKGLSETEEEE